MTDYEPNEGNSFSGNLGGVGSDAIMKSRTLFRNYINSSFRQSALFCVSLVIGCFAISPIARAVVPSPDGGYPNGNTAEGQAALLSLTTGAYNTAVGFLSLKSDIGGSFNTAIGAGTLLANASDNNTATGAAALLSNTGGASNTANGAFALFHNTTGYENTATGHSALVSNLDGWDNTANGNNALYRNDHGSSNTAIGASALYNNQGGYDNIAIGVQAGFGNTIGLGNTVVGNGALWANSTGSGNTAIGNFALSAYQTGNGNVAVGPHALQNNSSGSENIALGDSAGASITGYNNIDIGNSGQPGENDTIRIGASQTKTYIAGIYNVTTGAASIPVLIDAAGQVGTMSSSRRFKKEIKQMDETSDAILALKPVTFHYKSDATNTPQFGLIAEDVAEVNPDLVVRDKNGDIYTVRYEAVNAMLLNEFLKEHRKVEQQEVTIAQLKTELEAIAARQQKQIDALTAGLQKVSAQLELNQPTPQTVLNDQ